MLEPSRPRTSLARAVAASLALETRWLTAAYWGAALAFAAAFWLPAFAPCSDLPQHVATAAALHRWLDPASPERALFQLEPFTYNGLFEWLVALLAFALPIERAARLVVSLVPLLSAGAWLAVVAALRRPRWLALLLVPTSYSFALGYGFMDWALAAPLAMAVFALFAHRRRGTRGRGAALVLALGAWLVAAGHGFAMLCLLAAVAVDLAADPTPAELGFRAWLTRAARDLAPLAPALVWTALARAAHLARPDRDPPASREALDLYPWQKLWRLPTMALGDVCGALDDALFVAALGLALGPWVLAWLRRGAVARPARATVALAIAWTAAWMVMPILWMSAWFMGHRVLQWTLLFVVAAAPTLDARPRLERVRRGLAAAIALAAALNTAYRFGQIPEGADAEAIVAAVPDGAHVVSLVFSTRGRPGVEAYTQVHHIAYAAARRRVTLAVSFVAEYGGFPLRLRNAERSPHAPMGFDWSPRSYDPSAPWARSFDTVFVRTPDTSPREDPARRVFGDRADRVRTIAHFGRYWLYDAGRALGP